MKSFWVTREPGLGLFEGKWVSLDVRTDPIAKTLSESTLVLLLQGLTYHHNTHKNRHVKKPYIESIISRYHLISIITSGLILSLNVDPGVALALEEKPR